MALWYIGLIEEDGRFRAIDEHTEIPRRAALGLNHYPALLAAARAVVDDFTHDRPILRTSLKALQDAIEQQEQPPDA